MAQAVRSYGEAGMRFKRPAPIQPIQKGASGTAEDKADVAAGLAATEAEEAKTTGGHSLLIPPGIASIHNQFKVHTYTCFCACAGNAEEGNDQAAASSAAEIPSTEKPSGSKEQGAIVAQAEEGASAQGSMQSAPNRFLQGSETSAAALLAAYSTFGDAALPFVPFAPLFDVVL